MATDDTTTTRRSGAARGLFALARLVDLITALVCLVILAGILLVVLKANLKNDIAKPIHDIANSLTSPFHDLFTPKNKRLGVAINWGIALLVYFIIGRFIAAMISRVAARREAAAETGGTGGGFGRRRRGGANRAD